MAVLVRQAESPSKAGRYCNIAQLRADHPARLDHGTGPIWMATLGDLVLPLPNYRWRREALARHDANHLLTGYGFTAAEECRLAAWELGAGCYASPFARMLCALLLIPGVILGPWQLIKAYRAGRRHAISPGLMANPKSD